MTTIPWSDNDFIHLSRSAVKSRDVVSLDISRDSRIQLWFTSLAERKIKVNVAINRWRIFDVWLLLSRIISYMILSSYTENARGIFVMESLWKEFAMIVAGYKCGVWALDQNRYQAATMHVLFRCEYSTRSDTHLTGSKLSNAGSNRSGNPTTD